MYVDDKPYYDGYLDYNEEPLLKDFVKEIEIYNEIEDVRLEIYGLTNSKNELVKYRGRREDNPYELDSFIYYNDAIMDTYIFKYGVEPYSFEEMKQYFIEGSFLDDGELYLSTLKKYRRSLKARNSLKRHSKGEILLKEILLKERFEFEMEKSDGCINPETLYALPFDFIIFINGTKVYVEVQGGQHYKPVNFNNVDEEEMLINFRRLKERDSIKKRFAKENGIFVELDYSEGDVKKLEKRIYEQLIPLLKKVGGTKNDKE